MLCRFPYHIGIFLILLPTFHLVRKPADIVLFPVKQLVKQSNPQNVLLIFMYFFLRVFQNSKNPHSCEDGFSLI